MKVLVLALFALSSGSRVLHDDLHFPLIIQDPKVKYPLHLTDHHSFRSNKSNKASVLVKELAVLPGSTMTLDIQERRKFAKPNMYNVFVTGYNGTENTPVKIGTVSSILNPTPFRSHQDFYDGTGKSITRMHWSVRPSRTTFARAFIVKPNKRSKGTYYTFEKLTSWGARKQGIHTGRKEESFSVYRGKCDRKSTSGCGGLALQAIGHYKGFSFEFFLPGSTEKVAYMSMVQQSWGRGGKKQRFRLTVLPGADALMLTQLVSFIDLCNNDEQNDD